MKGQLYDFELHNLKRVFFLAMTFKSLGKEIYHYIEESLKRGKQGLAASILGSTKPCLKEFSCDLMGNINLLQIKKRDGV